MCNNISGSQSRRLESTLVPRERCTFPGSSSARGKRSTRRIPRAETWTGLLSRQMTPESTAINGIRLVGQLLHLVSRFTDEGDKTANETSYGDPTGLQSGKQPAEGEESANTPGASSSAPGPRKLAPVGPTDTGNGSPDPDWSTPPKMKEEVVDVDIPAVNILKVGEKLN